ncbi:MAG TPA: nucleoside deaminase [Xanthobacteraceae bacterium]|nr:nucleoside deaminase [Xanthobacteraceae bacterium]
MTAVSSRDVDQSELDKEMMRHCIRLSALAGERGEFPFASIICDGGQVIAEATNQVARDADVTRHAELLAISEAQKRLGRKDLSNLTIYSNVEPCVMCSFPMRETRISRVIYSISSPMMGGFSKWNVLRDNEISRAMPEAFGPVPEVIAGLLQKEAEHVWRKWNPLIWSVIKYRGCFGDADAPGGHLHLQPGPQQGLVRRLLTLGANRHSI